jgi:hypothetical protein
MSAFLTFSHMPLTNGVNMTDVNNGAKQAF